MPNNQPANDNNAIPLDISSFLIGSLPLRSYIRPAIIFTADKNLIIRKAGTVNGAVQKLVIDTICELLCQ